MYIDCSVRSRAFTFETDTSAWNRFIGKEGANINRIRQKLLEVGYRFEKSARIALYVGFLGGKYIRYFRGKQYIQCTYSFDTSTCLNFFESVTRMSDKGTLAVCFFFLLMFR